MTELNKDGFIRISGLLSNSDLNSCVHSELNGKINYVDVKNFIDRIFLPTIKKNIPMIDDPRYVKFRYSNNNNSVDASTLHSDTYDHTESEILPIFTCLVYFDDTQVEIIPGSHRASYSEKHGTLEAYGNRITVNINAGDIVVFHCNLFHRGKGYDFKGNRRILQVFDVFQNGDAFAQYGHKFCTVLTSGGNRIKFGNKMLYNISKTPAIIDKVNFLQFLLVYNDLHYKVPLLDLPPSEKKDRLISYESWIRLSYDRISGNDPININVICMDTLVAQPSNYYFVLFLIVVLTITIGAISYRKYGIPENMDFIYKYLQFTSPLRVQSK
jgi:hypothetical protein